MIFYFRNDSSGNKKQPAQADACAIQTLTSKGYFPCLRQRHQNVQITWRDAGRWVLNEGRQPSKPFV